MTTILVVGAGATGSAAAALLRRYWPADTELRIEVVDKARGCGGRLATARLDRGVIANMGAQRLHIDAADGSVANELAAKLVSEGVLRRTEDGQLTAGSNGAMNDTCRWLLDQAQASTHFGTCVRAIRSDGAQWNADLGGGDGTPSSYAGVIFAGTVAEVVTTHGDLDALVAPHRRRLSTAKYSRVCCASMVLQAGSAADAIRAALGALGGRVTDLAGTALDEVVLQSMHSSRGDSAGAVALVAVSTEAFGASVSGLRATHRPNAEDVRISQELLRTLQQSACAALVDRLAVRWSAVELMDCVIGGKLNYWKLARVQKAVGQRVEGHGAEAALPLAPGLVLCGDYFTASTFGGCLRSADAAARIILSCAFPPSPLRRLTTPPDTAPVAHSQDTGRGRSLPECPSTPVSPASPSDARILVVGAGLTGALTTRLLRRRMPLCCVHVLEMARGAGGRMSTARHSAGSGAPSQRANVGAQYVSSAGKGVAADALREASDAGLLRGPLDPAEVCPHLRGFLADDASERVDFAAPRGTSALVGHFLAAADALHFEQRLHSLHAVAIGAVVDGAAADGVASRSTVRWKAEVRGTRRQTPRARAQPSGSAQGQDTPHGTPPPTAAFGGSFDSQQCFDAIILAMPEKDAMAVGGDARTHMSGVAPILRRCVRWRSRFALSIWWAPAQRVAAAAFVRAAVQAHRSASNGRDAGDDTGVLDAVVEQDADGGGDADAHSAPVLTVQSTESFWQRHSRVHAGGGRGGGQQRNGGASAGAPGQVVGGGRAAVQHELLGALRGLCADLDFPAPAHLKLLNWRTSQVARPLTVPGTALLVSSDPPLVLTGDWATDSSFDGCAKAAEAAVALVEPLVAAAAVAGGTRSIETSASSDNGSGLDALSAKRTRTPRSVRRVVSTVEEGPCTCAACHLCKPALEFSKNQRSKGASARCHSCVAVPVAG